MFIAACDCDEVRREASKLLKTWDVKHRFKKNEFKPVEKKETTGVFKIRLERLRQKQVKLRQYDQFISVPAFVVDSCNYLRDRIETDGLFRRPGVAIRQKELKQILLSGGWLTNNCEHNVMDVADLLKLFFRELPEPCIPYVFHDILQRCLEKKENQKEAILLAILLLPLDYLYTLAYLLQFLQDVAAHRQSNRMDVGNLAIVWTPNLMPFKTGQVNNKQVLEKRLTIIQLLIEHSSCIGVIPECLYENLSSWQPSCSVSSHDDLEYSATKHREKKKKRRSGSLTRMLSELKKMVSSGSGERQPEPTTPDQPVTMAHTPCIMSMGKKRKASESNLLVFSSKKRRDLLESLPQGALLPDVCTTHLTPRVLVAQSMTRNGLIEEAKPKCRSRFYTSSTPERKEQKSHRSLSDSRLRLSNFGLGRKNKTKTVIPEDCGLERTATQNALDLSSASEDYVRISRSEYEDIKNRVSRIESRISSEFENIVGISMSDLEMTPDRSAVGGISTVQSAYEKTLESAEKLNSPTSNELARRFSRDLKIRGSTEKKVIRSPSARKIGSLRRRSKENAPQIKRNLSLNMTDQFNSRHQFYPVNNSIRRGKPNTVCNGLPDPLLISVEMSKGHLKKLTNQFNSESVGNQRESLGLTFEQNDFDLSSFGVLTRSRARKASSFHGCDLSKMPQSSAGLSFRHMLSTHEETKDWKAAEIFLNEENTDKISVTGRPSLTKLRSQNAGMVLAKAKLFNTMVDSNSNLQTKSSTTSKSTSKSREIKKRNSSKSSKERKLQGKDSRYGGQRSNRESSVPKQPTESCISPSSKIELHVALKRDNTFSNSKEKSKNRLQSVQSSLPKTPLQSSKISQSHHKEKVNGGQGKRLNLVTSPLQECNRYNPGSRTPRQSAVKGTVLGRSPTVTRQTLNENQATPIKTVSFTPRKSPRQLLLKYRQLK